jgi:hypothetical protein
MTFEDDNAGNTVECREHGNQGATILCRHLLTMSGRGFYTASADSSSNDSYPVAWCADCEAVLTEVGSWDERAVEFADFGTICHECYPLAKKRNQLRIVH